MVVIPKAITQRGKAMLTEDFIISVYCCVDDIFRETIKTPLRTRGFQPKLSDSEVITIEVVGEFLGYDQDKSIWRYFRNHWHSWFPNLGSRSNFVKQSANLYNVKELIHEKLVNKMNALDCSLHIVDGFPMPVCKTTRANRSRCFKGDAGYSYCAAKDEKYYGFEGHIIISSEGVICRHAFAAANIDERDILYEIANDFSGLLIADKGYIRPSLKEDLMNVNIDLQTSLRKNMVDSRPKEFVTQLMKTRRLIETVIGQLSQRFHIEKVWARDLWHLKNRFIRKLLSHTVGVFFSKLLGNHPLYFEWLITI
jgi:hypothetical protein